MGLESGGMLGSTIPNFWLALLLILLFSVTWDWFPVFGYGTASHIVLPAVTLGAGMAAVTTRLIRAGMLEVLKQDYIISARAHGISEKRVIFRHALKNAFIPVITVIGMQLGHLLEGTVIVESIFAWPGLGSSWWIPFMPATTLLSRPVYCCLRFFFFNKSIGRSIVCYS
ncbi:MAG: ABC transporter permease [Candidatus Syntrophopropionicum ammoniitolerans]